MVRSEINPFSIVTNEVITGFKSEKMGCNSSKAADVKTVRVDRTRKQNRAPKGVHNNFDLGTDTEKPFHPAEESDLLTTVNSNLIKVQQHMQPASQGDLDVRRKEYQGMSAGWEVGGLYDDLSLPETTAPPELPSHDTVAQLGDALRTSIDQFILLQNDMQIYASSPVVVPFGSELV